jgi:hypothetical protein
VCEDKLIAYLKPFGLSVLRLPRENFPPLQIMTKQGSDLVGLGQLPTVITGGVLPKVNADQTAAALSGQSSSDLSVGVGLTILGSFLGAMGAGNLGLDVQYKKAKTITFRFSDVLIDSIEVAELEQFLTASDVNPAAKHVGELLDADEIFVITQSVKSNKFTVEAKTQGGAGVQLSVPVIQQIVGGQVNITQSGAQNSLITYEGTKPLVFAFQAVRLYYDQGRYTAFEPTRPGNLAARAVLGDSQLPERVSTLETRGAFARVMTP